MYQPSSSQYNATPALAPYKPQSIYSTKPRPTPDTLGGTQYENICRHALRQRAFRTFSISLVFLWIMNSFFTFTSDNGLITEISELIAVYQITITSTAFLVALLPLLVHYRLSLHTTSPASPPVSLPNTTLYARITNLFGSKKAYLMLALYGWGGWFLALTYCTTAGIKEWEDPKLSIFVPTARNRFNLNERFVFLAFSNALLCISYALRSQLIFSPRSRISWPLGVSPSPRPNPVPSLRRAFIPTLKRGAIHALIFSTTYFILRRMFWRSVISIPILGRILRPHLSLFLRANKSPLSFDILWRLMNLSLSTILILEFSLTVSDIYASKPIRVSHDTPAPNTTLLSGILSNSSNYYFKHHASHELALLSLSSNSEDEKRRKTLFADLQSGGPGKGMWSLMVRELLFVLGADYRRVLNRGKVPVPPPAPPPAPPATTTIPPPSTPISSLKPRPSSEIYRPSATPASRSEKVLDSFSSEGESTKAMDEIVGVVGGIPKLFLGSPSSAKKPATPSSSGVVAKSAIALPSSVHDLRKWGMKKVEEVGRRVLPPVVVKKVEVGVGKFNVTMWGEDKVAYVKGVLDRRELDYWCIEALANLTAHSLQEDQYGVVQRDIPRILEALVKFSEALDAFVEEVVKGEMDAETEERVREVVYPNQTALKSGIHLIIATFRGGLDAFKFAPDVARSLQAMVGSES